MSKKERKRLIGITEMLEEYARDHLNTAIEAGKQGRKAADSYHMGKSVAFRRASQELRHMINE